MIDWHSHILPSLDDGSKSVNESISMLKLLSGQGISKVIATPHFYANDETVDDFIERRNSSYNELTAVINDLPEIICGAEVRYYQGIGRMEKLEKLCIGESNLLLLEMPFCKWTEYTVSELLELSRSNAVNIILAHVERYMQFQKDSVLPMLYENGILFQVNANAFSEFSTKRKVMKMLKNGLVHFIGSDCHDLKNRPPNIGSAYSIISKKLGNAFLEELISFGDSMLDN